MRELKFRAWLKDSRRMIHHDEISLTEGRVFERIYYPSTGFMNAFPRKDAELMLFTGITDKNGIGIYESDYVILNSSHKVLEATFEPEICVVQWRKDSPTMDMLNIKRLNADRKIGLTFDNGMVDEIEVIGNIYEGKRLLKGDS